MVLFYFFTLWLNTDGYEVMTRYQAIPEGNETFLQLPFAIAFAENGDLYVLDALAPKIHRWDRKGAYQGAFGKKGVGPGELSQPTCIDILGDHLWLYDHDGQRLSQFTSSGRVVRTIRTEIRAYKFVALSEDLFFSAYKKHRENGPTMASFELFDSTGKVVRVIKQMRHDGYLQRLEGRQEIKAFGPEMVIQKVGENRWIFGFSQENRLYLLNEKGSIIDTLNPEMITEPPTPEDIALTKRLSFPTSGGRNLSFSKWRHISLSYAHDKAFYTQFTQLDEKRMLFACTPLGGFVRTAGFPQASYFVSDLSSGKILKRGAYAFPEESVVLFQAGRVVAFTIREDGDYQVMSIQLPGTK